MSPNNYPPPNIFVSTGRIISTNNALFKTFGNAAPNDLTTEPQQTIEACAARRGFWIAKHAQGFIFQFRASEHSGTLHTEIKL